MSLTKEEINQLNTRCHTFRKDVVRVLHDKQTGHPGGSLSVCEILTVLYFKEMRVNPQNPNKPDRDRLVLSKGHAAPMLYRVLAEKGYFPVEEMNTFRDFETRLQGHPNVLDLPGIDMSAGPLGIGLSAGLGMAIALRMQKYDSRVYVVLGDGELNEGTNWEAAMAAAKFEVDNLCWMGRPPRLCQWAIFNLSLMLSDGIPSLVTVMMLMHSMQLWKRPKRSKVGPLLSLHTALRGKVYLSWRGRVHGMGNQSMMSTMQSQ